MKTIMKLIFAGFFILCIGHLSAQTASEPVTFNIKVQFHCANGKALLEGRLGALKGVSSAYADLDTKVVTIVHDPLVITQEYLIDIIEKIGYYTEFTDPSKPIKRACSHGDDDHDHNHDH